MPSPAESWLESLSPWPEEFGLERMRALLAELGDPQLRFRSIHVVGTNGKSTTTLMTEAILRGEGVRAGATISPHVRSWRERITVGDFDRAVERVRQAAERLGATQFEAVTAAAFSEFAAVGVDAAVVEAGLGGRLDATNVLDTRVVLLTNVGLEHTDVLGETAEEIAREKLAVAHADSIVVMSDNRFAHLIPGRRVVLGGAREAAAEFLGAPVTATVDVRLPGRLEEGERELRDGAHNADGVRWLLDRLQGDRYVVVASILADKDVDGMLAALSALGDAFVATSSPNPRALAVEDLAQRAHPFFARVEAVPDPSAAVTAARELAGEEGAVLVTGSLYLIADLASVRPVTALPWQQ